MDIIAIGLSTKVKQKTYQFFDIRLILIIFIFTIQASGRLAQWPQFQTKTSSVINLVVVWCSIIKSWL